MYLTQQDYQDITGKTIDEYQLKLASHLLDARIGAYCSLNDGFKLDKSRLNDKQVFIVEHWVAAMATTLQQTDGAVDVGSESISLGRFSVDYGGIEGNSDLIPPNLRYFDLLISSSGLVKRKLSIR